jgi:hypothetical protein
MKKESQREVDHMGYHCHDRLIGVIQFQNWSNGLRGIQTLIEFNTMIELNPALNGVEDEDSCGRSD